MASHNVVYQLLSCPSYWCYLKKGCLFWMYLIYVQTLVTSVSQQYLTVTCKKQQYVIMLICSLWLVDELLCSSLIDDPHLLEDKNNLYWFIWNNCQLLHRCNYVIFTSVLIFSVILFYVLMILVYFWFSSGNWCNNCWWKCYLFIFQHTVLWVLICIFFFLHSLDNICLYKFLCFICFIVILVHD